MFASGYILRIPALGVVCVWPNRHNRCWKYPNIKGLKHFKQNIFTGNGFTGGRGWINDFECDGEIFEISKILYKWGEWIDSQFEYETVL